MHLVRTATSIGLLDELRDGQRTLDELCQARYLNRETTALLLDALVSLGVVELYGDDYAISQAARLLNDYDRDLGDATWETLPDLLLGKTSRQSIETRQSEHRDIATQWTQTAASMQAAEILDVGGEGDLQSPRILDLGCGAAVWSSAMAHRSPQSSVVAVDYDEASLAAQNTADSIGLTSRFEFRGQNPMEIELESDHYDLVVLAKRLHHVDESSAMKWMVRGVDAAKPGGTVVVIDLFRGPKRVTLTESIEALLLMLETSSGHIRTLQEGQEIMKEAGLEKIQFTFLSNSSTGLGMCVGKKPSLSDPS